MTTQPLLPTISPAKPCPPVHITHTADLNCRATILGLPYVPLVNILASCTALNLTTAPPPILLTAHRKHRGVKPRDFLSCLTILGILNLTQPLLYLAWLIWLCTLLTVLFAAYPFPVWVIFLAALLCQCTSRGARALLREHEIYEKLYAEKIAALEAGAHQIKGIVGVIVEAGRERGLDWVDCDHWRVCWWIWNYNMDVFADARGLRRNGIYRSFTFQWERARFEEEWEICQAGLEWCAVVLTQMAEKRKGPWTEVCNCGKNHYVQAGGAGR